MWRWIVLLSVGLCAVATSGWADERLEDSARWAYVNTCDALGESCLEVFVTRDIDAGTTTVRYILLQQVDIGVWAIVRRSEVSGEEGEGDELIANSLFTYNGDYTVARLNHPVLQVTWRATSELLNTQDTKAFVRTPTWARTLTLSYVLRSAGVTISIDGLTFTEPGSLEDVSLHYLARQRNLDVTRDR